MIGLGEEWGKRISSLRTSGRNTIVLVSTKYRGLLGRWAIGVSFPEFFLDSPSRAALVCVLTDEVHLTSHEVDIVARAEKLPLTNVAGTIPGRRADETVLFGGHYDGKGILDAVDGDSMANGANDCASGTTAMIELARYFRAGGQPERTLMVAAFTAEEIGFVGSEYLARQLDPAKLVAMFSIAAIGKVDPRGPNRAHITGLDRSDFGKILQDAVEGIPLSFYADPYVGQNLFRRSDNAPFARRGVPAHAISTISIDPRDEDLHGVSDEVETLDFGNMTNVIRAIASGATPIISGKATPTRIDPPLRD